MNQVKFINVPLYDELSVKSLWPQMKTDEEFMQFFPNKLPKGRLPDRPYFFNVLNTLNEDYVQELIMHANAQRNTAEAEKMRDQTVVITEEWWDQLNAIPFMSCKSSSITYLVQNAREELFIFSRSIQSQVLNHANAERSKPRRLLHNTKPKAKISIWKKWLTKTKVTDSQISLLKPGAREKVH